MHKIVRPLMPAMIIAASMHGIAVAGQFSPTPQTRTYVSGTGSDGNACTASSPCKTFQAALALTVAGGEIFVLNSANYGAVTIDKAVTITSEGAVAGVLATGGVAITINAGAGDVVNLRGLDLDGGKTGTSGIQFSSGQALNIQKSAVRNFTNSGVSFAPSAGTSSLFVSDTVLANNGRNGILVAPSGSGAVKGALTRVVAAGNGLASNGVGIFAYGAGSSGAVSVTLTDTVANNNYYGAGAVSAAVMIRNSTLSNNGVGIQADQGAVVRVGQSTVTGNAVGWQATNGGLLQSFGTNNVSGNQTDGTLTSTLALQ
jgi:hypothetical protein